MKTTRKYFEVTLRVDQAVALSRLLSNMSLKWLVAADTIDDKEAKTLRGLRSQIDIELADRTQDGVVAVQSMGLSSFDNEREQEHSTDAVDAGGEVKGKYWLEKESGRVPPV